MIGGPGAGRPAHRGRRRDLLPGAAARGGGGRAGREPPGRAIYALNALSFLGVIVALLPMRTSGRVGAGRRRATSIRSTSLRAGLRFVFTTPIMVWTMALDFCRHLLRGLACRCCRSSPTRCSTWAPAGYGWLVAAPALGALLGSIYTSRRPLPRRQGGVLLWADRRLRRCATIVYGLVPQLLAHLRRPGRHRPGRPRLDRDPADPAPAPDPGRPARAHDVREHDLLHGRPPARRDGGGARGLPLRLRRPGGHASPWSPAGSPPWPRRRSWPRASPPRAATTSRPRPEDPAPADRPGSDSGATVPEDAVKLERLQVEFDGPVARVWLNRPGRRATRSTGSWSPSCARPSSTSRTVDAVRVIVLGGRGPAFCAGGRPASG